MSVPQRVDSSVQHISLAGLALVLFGQMAMAIENGNGAIRITFVAVMVASLLIDRGGLRIRISQDRARVFTTVGIVGYVVFGLYQLDLRSPEPRVEAFFTGLVLVFTVHQIGAILRLGRGGDPAPIYAVSAIHILGAANAQTASWRLPWLLGGWTLLLLILMWRESAPPLAPARRRWRTWPMLLTFLLMATIAAGVSLGLPQLQRWMQNHRAGWGSDSGVTGFHPQSAQLGIMRRMKLSSEPVLRLFGTERDGLHLRAMTYASFITEYDRWNSTDESSIDPEDARYLLWRTPGQGAGNRYASIPNAPLWDGERRDFDILLHQAMAASTRPAPLGTEAIRVADREDLMASNDSVLHVSPRDAAFACRRYTIEAVDEDWPPLLGDTTIEPLADAARSIYLGDPTGIPGIVVELATQVTAGAHSPVDEARRIESFLGASGKFEYALEVPKDYGVQEFLEADHRYGWCEYFATSMTLMLRARGIPSRYVTGYVVGEWNPIGGYYVVRGWDAHAWVEAWFPDLGWCTFDPTPPGMRRVEGANRSGILRGLWDWLGLTLGDTWRALTEGSFLEAIRTFTVGVAQAIWGMFLQPLVTAICAVVLVGVLMHLSFTRIAAKRLSLPPEDGRPEAVRVLEAAWRRAIVNARAYGLPIHAGDTPRQVLAKLRSQPTPGAPRAEDLEPLVDLIYTCRYGGAPLDLATVLARVPHT